MIYFGVGRGGAHIMAAFSRDLVHWTADAEPLYKAGGNPSGALISSGLPTGMTDAPLVCAA